MTTLSPLVEELDQVLKKIDAEPNRDPYQVISHAAQELALFAENDEPLYLEIEQLTKRFPKPLELTHHEQRKAAYKYRQLAERVHKEYRRQIGPAEDVPNHYSAALYIELGWWWLATQADEDLA